MWENHIRTNVLLGLLFLSCNLLAQSPGSVRRPSFWLHGEVSSGAAWQSSMNFHPAMNVDDSTVRIRVPGSIKSLRRVTIFTVYQIPGATQEKPIWKMNGNFGDLLLSTKQVSSKSRKTDLAFTPNTTDSYKPEKAQAIIHTYVSRKGTGSASENTGDNEAVIQFGNAKYSGSIPAAPGLISEFILYEKNLNEKEIAKVETYLALKYGITLEKNYLTASGETVWNRKTDPTYSNNIAGIARDDQSALYQKQGTSCNSPGQLVIGIHKIVSSNSKNTGQINNRDYLIWGDNAQPFTLNRNAAANDGEMALSEKKWLMKRSGSTAHTIATELKVDTKTLLTDSFQNKSFYLVIDRSGYGDFAPKNCLYILPDSISADGIASFNHLLWDTDGSGKDLFTFGLKPVPSQPANAQGLKNKNNTRLLSFQVYPNPVSDGHYQLAITLDRPTDIKIQVYDQNLRLIDSKIYTGQSTYLLPRRIHGASGAYTIQLITSETEVSRVIILQ